MGTLWSCKQLPETPKEPDVQTDPKVRTDPELKLTSTETIDFQAKGANAVVSFTANRDWKVSCSDSWITVSPSSGPASKDPISVTVRCSENTTYDDRSATISIEMEGLSQKVSVRQSASFGMQVPTKAFELTSDAQTIEVEVQANVTYSVSVSVDWIEQAETKGLVSDKLIFVVKENTTPDSREGEIIVKPAQGDLPDQVISVRQAQQDALIVTDAAYEMPFGGGEIEVKVEANVEFDVKSSADWIHHVQTKGLSSSVVCLSVDENQTYESREGAVEIVQKDGDLSHTVTVKQLGRIAVSRVELNMTALSLVVGESETLIATIEPEDATDPSVSWESDHPEVVAVDDQGVVSAMAEGTAIITASTVSGAAATCVVTVNYGVPRNQIWYTTVSGKPASVNGYDGYSIVSNTYKDGKGIVVFDRVLDTVPSHAFNSTDITSVEIPESVKSISYAAFCYCHDLVSVSLPESLESIGKSAFEVCSNLREIVLPSHLKVLGDGAFFESGLVSITLPEGLEIIEDSAFEYNEKLESAIISGSVQSIGRYAFSGCGRLKHVEIACANPPACFSNAFGTPYEWGGTFSANIYVPDESGAVYAAAQGWKDFLPLLFTRSGTPLTTMAYTSTDYSHDNEIVLLQKATVGRGINLLFLGDGFVDKDMETDGPYERAMRRGMEALFCWEPFKTFRNRFNVYTIKAISKNNSFGWDGSDRKFSEDNPNSLYANYDLVDRPSAFLMEYANMLPNPYDIPVSVILLFNADLLSASSSTGPMEEFGGNSFNHISDLKAIAHEMGHGFAELLDEYIVYSVDALTDEDRQYIDQKHSQGGLANIDYRSDPAEVYWSRFITDPRYSEERIGVYQGASFSRTELYRPAEESCMRQHQLAFNAPCREAIYKRIMAYSEGESWTYDYETFVEADAAGRQQWHDLLNVWGSPTEVEIPE